MMADGRRRSPEGSSKRRGPPSRTQYDAPPSRTGVRGAELIYSSSSSSSSYEYIDISRSFPPNKGGIRTFFTAPSEKRLRRKRSSRLSRHSNSSSESGVGDLAYGHGYLRRPRLRRVRSRKGKEIDRERYSERERERDRYTERYTERDRYSDREREKSGSGFLNRAKTDAEILAVGAGLAKLARDQNRLDLKSSKEGKTVYRVNEVGREGMSRGLGPSKVLHGSDTIDEDGWESASDAGSESSVDSRLAFGAESSGGWFSRKLYKAQSRKTSVVDPRLFGPQNSLHGYVTQPVGFGEVAWNSSSDFGQYDRENPQDSHSQDRADTERDLRDSYNQGRAESAASSSLPPMQTVYPYATEDSTRFDATKSSVISGPEPYISRPGPVPIQHPQPITPVSQSIYEPTYATKSETSTGILKKNKELSSGRSKSLAEAALIGVAGAAVGAALASDKERRRDDGRDTREDDHAPKRKDSERKDVTKENRKQKRDSPVRDDRTEKRREKDRLKDSPEDRKRDKREESRDERRARRREERRSERGDDRYDDKLREHSEERYDAQRSKSEAGVFVPSDRRFDDKRNENQRSKSEVGISASNVDPFKYQVPNDSVATLKESSNAGHGRVKSVPTVVTVEREPDFTRRRSSSIKDQPERYAEWDERDKRSRDQRDASLHNAEEIYEKERHFTAPIAAAAMTAAIAAEGYRESRSEKRRGERRATEERRLDYDEHDNASRDKSKRDFEDDYEAKTRDKDANRQSRDYDDYDRSNRNSKRSRGTERDPVQEEADRAYREIVMARKIASQVIRSRTPSPNRSVVDKYPEKEEEEPIRIVTPPGMDHKKKGPYDAPNADFQLDYVIDHPKELRRFSAPPRSRDRSYSDAPYLKKDADADLPRPYLNLVLPTPSSTPIPEKQVARSEPARKSKSQAEQKNAAASDVVMGPKGNVIPSSSTVSTVSKGVTWGENETKHFEVESPSEHRDEFISSPEIRARDTPAEQLKQKTREVVVNQVMPRSRSNSVEQPQTKIREEVVAQPKPRSRESSVEKSKFTSANKRGGWGAIAAGIIGAGAAAATSSETSKSSKSSRTKEDEKEEESAYEYRGIMVEPDTPSKDQRQQSPPTAGPKPTASQTSQSSRIPGAFDDDLGFAATVAAGLQDTGFDPNIVINDLSFRRRDSPPGSNEPTTYQAPYAESVSDIGSIMREAPTTRDARGHIIGEVATTPRDRPVVSPTGEDAPAKLSKKEQKKRDKASKRQSGDFSPLEESTESRDVIQDSEPYFETKLSKKEQKKRDKEARRQNSQVDDVRPLDETPIVAEIVQEPESYFEEPKKKPKKSKRGLGYEDDDEEPSRTVSVPVDAFDDLTHNNEEEWGDKKTKRKSKRDSDVSDSPSRSIVFDVTSPLEKTSSLSKKSKDKSKRKSDLYEPDPTEVSLPASTPSETSRDGDYEESRRTRKSSHKDSADRGDSRSVVSTRASRYDDDEPRKPKRKSKSRDDFDDTRSVASAPAGDDYEESKRSKRKDKEKEKEKDKRGSGFFGLFGSKSEVGASTRDDSPKRSKDDSEEVRKKSKKSKRSSMPDASSLYGDLGSQSISDLSRLVLNGNGNGVGLHDDQDRESRDESRKKSRNRDESTSSKKESFLAKAGTLGAGVGLAGAAVAIAAQRHQQSNADKAHESNETAEQTRSRGSSRPRQLDDILDPEIAHRQFRPSIDPQYGDLLPLPPSDPVSPNVDPVDDLPDLPDSRSHTPEAERLQQERAMASLRRTIQDTPMKSPSQSAVPLKFAIRGNRSNPSSPGMVRASPLQSPAATSQESLQFPRTRSRPSSWDNTREYKPLYLVESNRRGSNVQQQEPTDSLPELPPSEGSRSSSILDSSDEATFEDAEQYPEDVHDRFSEPLSINTGLAKTSAELLDSQQSTPKAGAFQDLDTASTAEPFSESKTTDETRGVTSHRSFAAEKRHKSPINIAAGVAAGAALVSSMGYSASAPVQKSTDKPSPEKLSSHSEVQRQPSPVDPMTKDRSSYLLQSSPMSKQTEDDIFDACEEESPTSRQRCVKDVLQSIREKDQSEDFEQSGYEQPAIEGEREKTLDTLAGSIHDLPAQDDAEYELPQLQSQHDASQAIKAAKPDEFVSTKPNKDKKKDKKKDKGLSKSSTQEEFSQPDTVRESAEETSISDEVKLTEEFSVPKSKKDRKGKDALRSSTQSVFDFQDLEPTLEAAEETSTSAAVEPEEEFSVPKSRKDKKKGKGLSRSSTQDDTSFEDTSREIFDASASPAVVELTEETSTPKSRKEKKKEKKNRKSVTIWEPETESPSAAAEEPLRDSSHIHIKAAVPAALGALGVAAYQFERSEDPIASLKTEERDAGEHSSLNVFDFEEKDDERTSKLEQSSIPSRLEEDPQRSINTADALRADPQDAASFDDFAPSMSKKNKKKKGRSVSTWEAQEEQSSPPPAIEAAMGETEPISELSMPVSKKGKKKGKKSLSWTAEETLPADNVFESVDRPILSGEFGEVDDHPTANDGFESIAATGSKKNNKGKESQFWTPKESMPILDEPPVDTIENPHLPMHSKSHENPADRDAEVTNQVDEQNSNISVVPESLMDIQARDDATTEKAQHDPNIAATSSEAHFPSTATILPVAAGAAVSAAHHLAETSDNKDQSATSRSLESESSIRPEQKNEQARPVPDGLKAGYKDDQLSLARQLQEEFGNGSKKSKKDKKKRQSLPAIPDRESSRSRDPNEDLKDYHRARSLSMRPSPSNEESSIRPMSEDRRNVYSEDQYELARQLKVEFEGGNKKKSKEDKKRRQSLPRTSTHDDANLDNADDDPEVVPESMKEMGSRDQNQSNRDGFEAGYQEDQLSLARQLQAEFGSGSGSKKSKKEKKRRSTAQTPLQEPEQADYFGDAAQDAETTLRELETADTTGLSGIDKEVTRDGLAVGYKEEQLELARQLKDEFSSGSSKSKKGKKDKKRQSLLRNTTEDDFSAEFLPKDSSEFRGMDSQIAETSVNSESRPDEPFAAEPEDEFAFISKKSKKDKKDRKRESVVDSAATEDVIPEAVSKDLEQTRNNPQEASEPLSESTPAELKDEFAFTTKESKKDKKSKKRGSITPAVVESEVPLEDSTKEFSEPVKTDDTQPADTESRPMELPGEPEDEFTFTAKRSKKGKTGKKHEILTPAIVEFEFSPGITSKDINESTKIKDSQPSVTETSSKEPATENVDNEFGLPRKKSKKDKKRDSFVPATSEVEPSFETVASTIDPPSSEEAPRSTSEAQVDQSAEDRETRDSPVAEVEPILVASENPEDDSGLTRRNSKTDPKGKQRESVIEITADDDVSNSFGNAVEALHNNRELPEDSKPIDEAFATPVEDDWSALVNKSKVDKKRQSLTTQGSLDQPTAEAESDAESGNVSTVDVQAPIPAARQYNEPDDVEYSTKKSKDKKKSQSLLQTSIFKPTPGSQPEITPLPKESLNREFVDDFAVAIPALDELHDDGLEVSSKKSEKGKKKRQSAQEPMTSDERTQDVDQPFTSEALPTTEDISKPSDIPAMHTNSQNPAMTDHTNNLLDDSNHQIPAEVIEETPEVQFESFAFTPQKSKKDKKKRKYSSLPESGAVSGISTRIDPIQDTATAISESSVPKEVQLETTKVVEQLLNQATDEADPAESSNREVVDDLAGDDWGSFSIKKSKKDKKKRKSGISTPIEEPELQPVAATSNQPIFVKEAKEISEQSSNTVDENWGSLATKGSKKDKKNRKYGLPTPAEETPLPVETVSEDPSTLEKVVEPSLEQVQEPVDEEWGSITAKKSKKDKRKSKSGHSTPLEETLPESSAVDTRDLADVAQPSIEAKKEDPIDDDGSLPTEKFKKDKKDKKKGKPGSANPLEAVDEPSAVVPEHQATDLPATDLGTQSPTTQPASGFQNEIFTVEGVPPQAREPGDDEWASTTQKDQKDKERRKFGSVPTMETFAEVGPSSSPADFIPNDEPKSQLEQLLGGGVFTTTKSKREKKNRSGISTPIEDESQPDQQTDEGYDPKGPELPTHETAVEDTLNRSAAVEEAPSDDKSPVQEPPNRQSILEGLPIPVQEPPVATESSGQVDTPQEVALPPEDPADDEWGSFVTKKSKKGKKGKSGISTPVEGPSQSALSKDITESKSAISQPPSAEEDVPASRIPQEDGAPEAFEFTTKKSKKDKKKRKSGISTPLEESPLPVEPEQTLQTGNAEVDEPIKTMPAEVGRFEAQISSSRQDGENAKDILEPVKEEGIDGSAFDFVTKRSKKDKKKRKSGLSTPIDETLPIVQFEETSQADQTSFDQEETQQVPHEPEAESVRDLPQVGDNIQEVTADDFEFSMKKSKDKKKYKSDLSSLEETLLFEVPESSSRDLAFDDPIVQPEPIERETSESMSQQTHNAAPEYADDGFEFTTKKSKKEKKGKKASRANSESGPSASIVPPTAAIVPESLAPARFTGSPGPVGTKSAPQQLTRSAPMDDSPQASTHETQPNESEDAQFGLGKKPSKKDKRKRQATVADIPAGPADSKAPLTSWADEVEEAEVERKDPIIEDIAKDESLSHIASTTETALIDDFSRPTKKGKKGKKRQSGLTRDSSVDEFFRPPIGDEASEAKRNSHDDATIIAATGAAIAGSAALLSGRSTGHEGTSASYETKEAETPALARKLSKKEKRKENIDRRAPSDDPFDDPTLWEGAEPRSFEESNDANNDAGSDGFWDAPNRDENFPIEEPTQTREPYHEGPVDLFATPRGQDAARDPEVESATTRDTPAEQLWTESSSRKDEKRAEHMASETGAIEEPIHFLSEQATVVEEPSIDKPDFVKERSLMHPRDYVEELPIDRNLSFREDEFRPRSSLRYSQHGASPLPVVREESPVQMDSDDINRDSAFITDSPTPAQGAFTNEHIRDSGVHLRESSPAMRVAAPVSSSDDAIARLSWPPVDESSETIDLHRSQRPRVETPKHERHARAAEFDEPYGEREGALETERRPKAHDDREQKVHGESHTDLHRTKTIHRSHSPLADRHSHHGRDRDTLPSQNHEEESHSDLHRTKTVHRSQKPDSLVKQCVQRFESPDLPRSQTPKDDRYGDLASQRPKAEISRSTSDNSEKPRSTSDGSNAAIGGTVLGFAAARQASRENRPDSAQSQRSGPNINRLRTPDPKVLRPDSVLSNRSSASGTPPLRRSDRKSGDLRSLSQRSNLDLSKEAELAAITTAGAVTGASSTNPQANEGRARAKEMADVYDGFGEGRMGSPRSPTRPHSMRRRQSMQVLDLEQRLEQLAAENRALAEAKAQADRALQTSQHASSALVERDAELESLKRTLAWLQNEVTKLTEVNDGLTSAHVTLGNQHNDRYNALESQHAQAARELQEVRDSHNNISAGMEGIVKNEVQTAVQEKDAEIAELRAQLEAAKEQIRTMQRQILESKANDDSFLTIRDEDYFDNACQQLCQHVQQWVLRFSKFSDMRACRLTSEINNDKIIDRLDNAILDGTDVDSYLADRVKRRDVFMSMTMTMVWEFVFTRYLFGMDREQRQKLKSLEKLLSDVGPASAVHQWRAVTLTLLSKRETFVQQREQDTLAVVNAILETLTEILPPPSNLEQQIQEQLTRVMKAAVDLSIEMRTQRAEYMMLPPLQPEYDANGDLASKVSFNAALMNERSGDTASNEDLEAQKAVVRIVLFPLVVKKGDDSGEGDEEIVVCPAQVLVAKPRKQVRIFSNGSQANQSRMSMQSSMPAADYGDGSVI